MAENITESALNTGLNSNPETLGNEEKPIVDNEKKYTGKRKIDVSTALSEGVSPEGFVSNPVHDIVATIEDKDVLFKKIGKNFKNQEDFDDYYNAIGNIAEMYNMNNDSKRPRPRTNLWFGSEQLGGMPIHMQKTNAFYRSPLLGSTWDTSPAKIARQKDFYVYTDPDTGEDVFAPIDVASLRNPLNNYVIDGMDVGDPYLRMLSTSEYNPGLMKYSIWGNDKLYGLNVMESVANFAQEATIGLGEVAGYAQMLVHGGYGAFWKGLNWVSGGNLEGNVAYDSIVNFHEFNRGLGVSIINVIDRMKWQPSFEVQNQGMFSNPNAFLWHLGGGLGLLMPQRLGAHVAGRVTKATMAKLGKQLFVEAAEKASKKVIPGVAEAIGREGAEIAAKNTGRLFEASEIATRIGKKAGVKTSLKELTPSSYNYLLEKAIKKNAMLTSTAIGTLQAVGGVREEAAIAGLSEEVGDMFAIATSPMVALTEWFLGARYLTKGIGDDSITPVTLFGRDGLGVKLLRKEVKEMLPKFMAANGTAGVTDKQASFFMGRVLAKTLSGIGKASKAVSSIPVITGGLHEFAQEGLEEAGYIVMENAYNKINEAFLDNRLKGHFKDVTGAAAWSRIKENAYGGLVLGGIMDGITGTYKSKNQENFFNYMAISGQTEEAQAIGRRTWSQGYFGIDGINWKGEQQVEGEQGSGVVINQNGELDSWGLPKNFEIKTLNDLNYYNYIQQFELTREAYDRGVFDPDKISAYGENPSIIAEVLNITKSIMNVEAEIKELNIKADEYQNKGDHNAVKAVKGEIDSKQKVLDGLNTQFEDATVATKPDADGNIRYTKRANEKLAEVMFSYLADERVSIDQINEKVQKLNEFANWKQSEIKRQQEANKYMDDLNQSVLGLTFDGNIQSIDALINSLDEISSRSLHQGNAYNMFHLSPEATQVFRNISKQLSDIIENDTWKEQISSALEQYYEGTDNSQYSPEDMLSIFEATSTGKNLSELGVPGILQDHMSIKALTNDLNKAINQGPQNFQNIRHNDQWTPEEEKLKTLQYLLSVDMGDGLRTDVRSKLIDLYNNRENASEVEIAELDRIDKGLKQMEDFVQDALRINQVNIEAKRRVIETSATDFTQQSPEDAMGNEIGMAELGTAVMAHDQFRNNFVSFSLNNQDEIVIDKDQNGNPVFYPGIEELREIFEGSVSKRTYRESRRARGRIYRNIHMAEYFSKSVLGDKRFEGSLDMLNELIRYYDDIFDHEKIKDEDLVEIQSKVFDFMAKIHQELNDSGEKDKILELVVIRLINDSFKHYSNPDKTNNIKYAGYTRVSDNTNILYDDFLEMPFNNLDNIMDAIRRRQEEPAILPKGYDYNDLNVRTSIVNQWVMETTNFANKLAYLDVNGFLIDQKAAKGRFNFMSSIQQEEATMQLYMASTMAPDERFKAYRFSMHMFEIYTDGDEKNRGLIKDFPIKGTFVPGINGGGKTTVVVRNHFTIMDAYYKRTGLKTKKKVLAVAPTKVLQDKLKEQMSGLEMHTVDYIYDYEFANNFQKYSNYDFIVYDEATRFQKSTLQGFLNVFDINGDTNSGIKGTAINKDVRFMFLGDPTQSRSQNPKERYTIETIVGSMVSRTPTLSEVFRSDVYDISKITLEIQKGIVGMGQMSVDNLNMPVTTYIEDHSEGVMYVRTPQESINHWLNDISKTGLNRVLLFRNSVDRVEFINNNPSLSEDQKNRVRFINTVDGQPDDVNNAAGGTIQGSEVGAVYVAFEPVDSDSWSFLDYKTAIGRATHFVVAPSKEGISVVAKSILKTNTDEAALKEENENRSQRIDKLAEGRTPYKVASKPSAGQQQGSTRQGTPPPPPKMGGSTTPGGSQTSTTPKPSQPKGKIDPNAEFRGIKRDDVYYTMESDKIYKVTITAIEEIPNTGVVIHYTKQSLSDNTAVQTYEWYAQFDGTVKGNEITREEAEQRIAGTWSEEPGEESGGEESGIEETGTTEGSGSSEAYEPFDSNIDITGDNTVNGRLRQIRSSAKRFSKDGVIRASLGQIPSVKTHSKEYYEKISHVLLNPNQYKTTLVYHPSIDLVDSLDKDQKIKTNYNVLAIYAEDNVTGKSTMIGILPQPYVDIADFNENFKKKSLNKNYVYPERSNWGETDLDSYNNKLLELYKAHIDYFNKTGKNTLDGNDSVISVDIDKGGNAQVNYSKMTSLGNTLKKISDKGGRILIKTDAGKVRYSDDILNESILNNAFIQQKQNQYGHTVSMIYVSYITEGDSPIEIDEALKQAVPIEINGQKYSDSKEASQILTDSHKAITEAINAIPTGPNSNLEGFVTSVGHAMSKSSFQRAINFNRYMFRNEALSPTDVYGLSSNYTSLLKLEKGQFLTINTDSSKNESVNDVKKRILSSITTIAQKLLNNGGYIPNTLITFNNVKVVTSSKELATTHTTPVQDVYAPAIYFTPNKIKSEPPASNPPSTIGEFGSQDEVPFKEIETSKNHEFESIAKTKEAIRHIFGEDFLNKQLEFTPNSLMYGTQAYGAVADFMIRIYAKEGLARKGIAYHEAVHYALKYFISPESRQAILQDARGWISEQPNMDERSMADKDVEEWLADISMGEITPITKPKTLLNRFVQWVNRIFRNARNTGLSRKFLEDLKAGKYRNAEPVYNNYSSPSFSSMTEEDPVEGLTEGEEDLGYDINVERYKGLLSTFGSTVTLDNTIKKIKSLLFLNSAIAPYTRVTGVYSYVEAIEKTFNQLELQYARQEDDIAKGELSPDQRSDVLGKLINRETFNNLITHIMPELNISDKVIEQLFSSNYETKDINLKRNISAVLRNIVQSFPLHSFSIQKEPTNSPHRIEIKGLKFIITPSTKEFSGDKIDFDYIYDNLIEAAEDLESAPAEGRMSLFEQWIDNLETIAIDALKNGDDSLTANNLLSFLAMIGFNKQNVAHSKGFLTRAMFVGNTGEMAAMRHFTTSEGIRHMAESAKGRTMTDEEFLQYLEKDNHGRALTKKSQYIGEFINALVSIGTNIVNNDPVSIEVINSGDEKQFRTKRSRTKSAHLNKSALKSAINEKFYVGDVMKSTAWEMTSGINDNGNRIKFKIDDTGNISMRLNDRSWRPFIIYNGKNGFKFVETSALYDEKSLLGDVRESMTLIGLGGISSDTITKAMEIEGSNGQHTGGTFKSESQRITANRKFLNRDGLASLIGGILMTVRTDKSFLNTQRNPDTDALDAYYQQHWNQIDNFKQKLIALVQGQEENFGGNIDGEEEVSLETQAILYDSKIDTDLRQQFRRMLESAEDTKVTSFDFLLNPLAEMEAAIRKEGNNSFVISPTNTSSPTQNLKTNIQRVFGSNGLLNNESIKNSGSLISELPLRKLASTIDVMSITGVDKSLGMSYYGQGKEVSQYTYQDLVNHDVFGHFFSSLFNTAALGGQELSIPIPNPGDSSNRFFVKVFVDKRKNGFKIVDYNPNTKKLFISKSGAFLMNSMMDMQMNHAFKMHEKALQELSEIEYIAADGSKSTLGFNFKPYTGKVTQGPVEIYTNNPLNRQEAKLVEQATDKYKTLIGKVKEAISNMVPGLNDNGIRRAIHFTLNSQGEEYVKMVRKGKVSLKQIIEDIVSDVIQVGAIEGMSEQEDDFGRYSHNMQEVNRVFNSLRSDQIEYILKANGLINGVHYVKDKSGKILPGNLVRFNEARNEIYNANNYFKWKRQSAGYDLSTNNSAYANPTAFNETGDPRSDEMTKLRHLFMKGSYLRFKDLIQEMSNRGMEIPDLVTKSNPIYTDRNNKEASGMFAVTGQIGNDKIIELNPFYESFVTMYHFVSKGVVAEIMGDDAQFVGSNGVSDITEYGKYYKGIVSQGYAPNIQKNTIYGLPSSRNVVIIQDAKSVTNYAGLFNLSDEVKHTDGLIITSDLYHRMYSNSLGGDMAIVRPGDITVKSISQGVDVNGYGRQIKSSKIKMNEDMYAHRPEEFKALMKFMYDHPVELYTDPNTNEKVYYNPYEKWLSYFDKSGDLESANNGLYIDMARHRLVYGVDVAENMVHEIVFKSTIKYHSENENPHSLNDIIDIANETRENDVIVSYLDPSEDIAMLNANQPESHTTVAATIQNEEIINEPILDAINGLISARIAQQEGKALTENTEKYLSSLLYAAIIHRQDSSLTANLAMNENISKSIPVIFGTLMPNIASRFKKGVHKRARGRKLVQEPSDGFIEYKEVIDRSTGKNVYRMALDIMKDQKNSEEVLSREVTEAEVDAMIESMQKDGVLEIDCSEGAKAAKGMRGEFSTGGEWQLVKDLTGYPSHAKGGVDLTMGPEGVSFARGQGNIIAAHGLVLPASAIGLEGFDRPDYEAMSKVITERNKHLNWVQRGLEPDNYPNIQNEDGSVSTHRLAYSTDDDGGGYVYPTIIQNEAGELQELSGEEALKYALETNTGIRIPNIDLADYYSRNGLIKH